MVTMPVAAQEGSQQQEQQTGQQQGDAVEVLREWNYAPLYEEGWSVEQLLYGAEVYGEDGEEIGDVENLVFRDDGTVVGLIAEVGGFWDIGDTHVAVPWDEVAISETDLAVTVPVTEETIGDYSVFGEGFYEENGGEVVEAGEAEGVAAVSDDVQTGPGLFNATDMIGDYAYLEGDVQYGYVSDAIIQDGAISAIVVDATAYGMPGYYAYPYAGYGRPYDARYDMPYGAGDIRDIESFDYDQLVRPEAEQG
jgi:sporulation protein YlmC with PRC-barrel domain